ncbi:MAG: SRPBCC domain-containing protein [Planctomycetota bacterium]
MTTPTTSSSNQAVTIKRLFSRTTSVAVDIAAPPEVIWSRLTDAKGMPSWNSSIVELSGSIAPGETIHLRSTLAPKRTFHLKVKQFEPPSLLSWGDAMGTRTYQLTPQTDGQTRVSMTERIGGPLFPLFAKLIPSFDDAFNQFAADLKSTCEQAAA